MTEEVHAGMTEEVHAEMTYMLMTGVGQNFLDEGLFL